MLMTSMIIILVANILFIHCYFPKIRINSKRKKGDQLKFDIKWWFDNNNNNNNNPHHILSMSHKKYVLENILKTHSKVWDNFW